MLNVSNQTTKGPQVRDIALTKQVSEHCPKISNSVNSAFFSYFCMAHIANVEIFSY